MTAEAPWTRHDTFTLSRHVDATRGAVFELFENTDRWLRWFRMPGSNASYEHDFRVGRGDHAQSTFRHADGRTERLENRSTYLCIDAGTRIVYAYESTVDDRPRWASLVTVELDDDGNGTDLSWTEQVAFLEATGDGSSDLPHLRGGVRLRLNGLDQALT
jgi:uncharacterized protein YndB with AHSA1/START domain